MTVTLDEIHNDPWIIDRAILKREPLQIICEGEVAATLAPAPEKLPFKHVPFDAEAHRAWLDKVWGDEVDTMGDMKEMRAAQERVFGE